MEPIRRLSEQVRRIDVRGWKQKANANLGKMKGYATKCKKEVMEAASAYRKLDRKRVNSAS